MKYITIHTGENKIELFYSFIGKEIVKVNGEKVSSRFSIIGANHIFEITENENKVECILSTGIGVGGIVVSLYIGGEPMIESERMNNSLVYFFFIVVLAHLIDFIARLFA